MITLSLLQKAFNHYLALDPEALKRFSTLSGKVVQLTLTSLNTSFYLFPNKTGIDIQIHYTGKIDASIKGSIIDLTRIRFADKKTASSLMKKLEITGDTHLAQTFNQILKEIDIDWEEPLSHLTGDIIAHQIGSFVRRTKQYGSHTKQSLQQNITEYLQEEIRLLPPREEIEDFFAQIKRLQHDIDRLEKI